METNDFFVSQDVNLFEFEFLFAQEIITPSHDPSIDVTPKNFVNEIPTGTNNYVFLHIVTIVNRIMT